MHTGLVLMLLKLCCVDILFVRDERRVISMDEKKVRDLLEQATSDSEKPAPKDVVEQLSKEARAASPETAWRMARWLEVRLLSNPIPVVLKPLQLIDCLLQEVSAAVALRLKLRWVITNLFCIALIQRYYATLCYVVMCPGQY